MCNLYTLKTSAEDVAGAFNSRKPANFNAGPGDVYPGGPSMVIREEERERILEAMTWGFSLAQKSKKTGKPIKPKPVTNARADKLDTFFGDIALKSAAA